MTDWIDSITFDAFSTYLLILTENKNNKRNDWAPPSVLAVPVHPNDASPKGFNLDAMGQIEQYKRRCLAGILAKLNDRDNGKCIWTAYRLAICDDKGLLFTVKATASSAIRPVAPPNVKTTAPVHQADHSVANGTNHGVVNGMNHSVANSAKPLANGFAKPQGQLQPAFANGYGNQQATLAANQGFGSTNQGFGVANQSQGFGSANQQGFGNTNQQGFRSNNQQSIGSTNQQGFGNANQGFGATNQGFGNGNQGFGNANRGPGNTNQGFGNANQGFGTANQGFGSQNQGFGGNGFGDGGAGGASENPYGRFMTSNGLEASVFAQNPSDDDNNL
ncbi:hypothetical protein TWF718_000670 [Orbilia javanica]|uniref:Uncharacterized protein n=1 Tax=Orbilia javanica TaxID=47235 RepID=A0AAN8MXG0_9PEZI